jgi:hypothetical protein
MNTMSTPEFFTRIPFQYGGYKYERGEIFSPKGLPRDAQLLGLGYYLPYDKHEHSLRQCDNCGKQFASEPFYIMHKSKPGGCLAPSAPITKMETAMLLGKEPKEVRVEE